MSRESENLPVIDVHVHLIDLDPVKLQAIQGVDCIDGRYVEVDGHPVKLEALYQPPRLIEWMDEQGIDAALISTPPPLYRQHLCEGQSKEWVTYVNDGLKAIAARYPERLEALVHLPLEHPKIAADEAEKRQGQHYAGYSIAAGGDHEVDYLAPGLRSLWGFLHETKSFVLIHPGGSCDPRLERFYGRNLSGNPHETALAASHLVFGGIAEDFPAIAFCLAHCGGAVPALAGRWQRGFDTARPGVDTSREPPARCLRRFYVDCIAHHPGLIGLAEQVFGEDSILFGSDWPFPMGIRDLDDQLKQFGNERKERILRRNFRAVLAK